MEIQQHIWNCTKNFYDLDNKDFTNFCGRGSIFVKININASGKSIDIVLSKDSSLNIATYLKSVLDKINQDKDLIFTLNLSRQTILLPFIYNYEAGCYTGFKTTAEEARKSMSNYMNAMDNLYSTVLDMLNFPDGKLDFLNCLLLDPYRIDIKT